MNEDRFELTSITDEVLKWMIERDGIFQRWDSARKAGTISWKPGDDETSYGALPDEMDRCRDLNLKIETFLKETMPAHFVYGDFEIESPVRTRVRWRTVLSDSGVR